MSRPHALIGPLAELVAASGGRRFWSVLARVLERICAHDLCVVLRYSPPQPPAYMYDNFTGILSSSGFAEYRSGAYLLDPFYRAYLAGTEAGARRLREVAPDRFFRSEYYRTYYHKTGVADEACLFSRLRSADIVITSLSRRPGRRPFGRADAAALGAHEPLLTALIRQHLARTRPRPRRGAAPADGPVAAAAYLDRLRRRAGQPLTRREMEIGDYILRGHSTLSTALQFGISVETVRVHRRHLYRKLDISTQAELFAVAMGTVPRRGGGDRAG